MKPQTVAIVGINYSPEVTGCAPYTQNLAESLQQSGFAVTVVTGVPHYPGWRTQANYSRGLFFEEKINNVTVLRARHYVPSKMNSLRRGLYELSFLLSATVVSRRLQANHVIAVSPSLGSALIGWRVAKKSRQPLKILVQDMMAAAAEQSRIRGGRFAAKAVRIIERFAFSRADSIGIISDHFRVGLRSYGIDAQRITLLPNYTHSRIELLPQNDARARFNLDQNLFVALHTGNMGLKQGLYSVVTAGRQLYIVDPNILILLVGDGHLRAELEFAAQGLSNVKFMDLVPAEDYGALLSAADVLLISEIRSQLDMSLPSKLTSYLATDKPIIAAVPRDGATWQAIANEVGIIDCDPENADALAQVLVEMKLSKASGSEIARVSSADTHRSRRITWALS